MDRYSFAAFICQVVISMAEPVAEVIAAAVRKGFKLPGELKNDGGLLLELFKCVTEESAAWRIFLKEEMIYLLVGERLQQLHANDESRTVEKWQKDDREKVRQGGRSMSAPKRLFFKSKGRQHEIRQVGRVKEAKVTIECRKCDNKAECSTKYGPPLCIACSKEYGSEGVPKREGIQATVHLYPEEAQKQLMRTRWDEEAAPAEEVPLDFIVLLADAEREAQEYAALDPRELYATVHEYQTVGRRALMEAVKLKTEARVDALRAVAELLSDAGTTPIEGLPIEFMVLCSDAAREAEEYAALDSRQLYETVHEYQTTGRRNMMEAVKRKTEARFDALQALTGQRKTTSQAVEDGHSIFSWMMEEYSKATNDWNPLPPIDPLPPMPRPFSWLFVNTTSPPCLPSDSSDGDSWKSVGIGHRKNPDNNTMRDGWKEAGKDVSLAEEAEFDPANGYFEEDVIPKHKSNAVPDGSTGQAPATTCTSVHDVLNRFTDFTQDISEFDPKLASTPIPRQNQGPEPEYVEADNTLGMMLENRAHENDGSEIKTRQGGSRPNSSIAKEEQTDSTQPNRSCFSHTFGGTPEKYTMPLADASTLDFTTTASIERKRGKGSFLWDHSTIKFSTLRSGTGALSNSVFQSTAQISECATQQASDVTGPPVGSSDEKAKEPQHKIRQVGRVKEAKVTTECRKCDNKTECSTQYGPPLCIACSKEYGRICRNAKASKRRCTCTPKRTCAWCRYDEWMQIGCKEAQR